jgi:hypothetical protein
MEQDRRARHKQSLSGSSLSSAPANDLVVKLWASNEIVVVGNPADQAL